MSRRDLLLEEMGIAPRWRLRAPVDTAGPTDTAHAPASSKSSASSDAKLERAAEAKAPVSKTPGTEAGGPVPRTGPEGPLREAVAASMTQADPEGRRRKILAMDWTALESAVAQCTACPLHAKRNRTVFGVGDRSASWLFVGEGPGAEEDARGEPFVGQAGRLLDNMLAAIELRRGEDVYIANVVKCRPPNNRNPESGEMSCCEPYLTRQIELIRPTLIVAMGKIAASHLLQTDASIASLRGRVHEYRGTPLLVTYHPAYLLRTLPDKAKAWTDLCFARDRMDALVAARAASRPPATE